MCLSSTHFCTQIPPCWCRNDNDGLSQDDPHFSENRSKPAGLASKPEEDLRLLHPRGSRPATRLLTRIGERPTAILADRVPNK